MKKRASKRYIIPLIAVLLIGAWILLNLPALQLIRYNAFPTVFDIPEEDIWEGGQQLNLAYSEISENTYLTLYLPDDPGEEKPPLMILFYGGGAVMNDNHSRQVRLMYDYFRDHGYACASVNYRLAKEALAPAAIEDAKAAIRFLRVNADKYGYDSERFVVAGESTGVYIGFVAVATGEEQFSSVPFVGQEAFLEPVSSEVSAIVDFYAFMDPLAEDDEPFALPGWITHLANNWNDVYLTEGLPSWLESWVGKRLEDFTEEDKALLNAYCYFEGNKDRINRLAVWIAHGDAEITVPYTQSLHFYERLCRLRGWEPNWDEDTRTGTTGSLHLEILPGFKHADDQFYSDDMLAKVDRFLQNAWN